MKTILLLFGEGRELLPHQMCLRAILIFIVGLVLIRISGRRAFGMRMSFDNVVTILLGALLSRAINGASPFFSTIAAATTIVLCHRLCGWFSQRNKTFGYLVKGESKVLYDDGKLNIENMKYGRISERDLFEGIRINGIERLEQAKTIYLERNGQISVIKKEEEKQVF